MKKLLLILMVACLAIPLSAQRMLDVASLSGRYGLAREYKDTYGGEATEFGSINSITAGVSVAERTKIPISFNHFYFHVEGDSEIPDDQANPIGINGFILRTGLYQYLGNGNAIQLLIAPRIMSDFKNLDGNSFQLGALFAYEKKFKEDLTMSFGAMFNKELFGPYVVPFVDLHWQVASRLRIDGMLPITARVVYKVNDNMSTGLNYFGLITTYYLGDEAYAGDYMERQSIEPSLFLRHRLFSKLFVEGMVGRTLGRKYVQYAGDQKVDFALPLLTFGDERVAKNVTFKDGVFFTLKLIVNLPYPEWE